MSDEEIKKLILARRAAFIAAAVAGIAAASCDPKPSYKDVCLQPQYDPSAQPPSQYPPPQVCLSPMPAQEPDASAGGVAPAEPQPCLSPMIPPQPDASAPKKP